jgi:branched-chain amino acid transport system substrate-binding protein
MNGDLSYRRGVTRRGFLTVAVSAIVAGVVAGVGAYYAGILSAPTKEVTETVTKTVTIAPGAPVTTTVTVTQPPITVTKTETVTVTATPKISGEPIKIAVLTNLTGALAGVYFRVKLVYDALVEEINRKGGVYLKETGAYHKIQLLYYDCESTAARAAELATKVATEKQVNFIILNTGPSPITIPAAINVEKVGGTPTLVESAVDLNVKTILPAFGGKVTWLWFFHFDLTDLVFQNSVPFLASVKEKTNGILGILYHEDPQGRYYVEELKVLDHLERIGYHVVFPGLIPLGSRDLTAVITKFKEANVEAIYANLMPDTAALFLSQSVMLGFKPKIIVLERAVAAAGSPDPFGDPIIGVIAGYFWWDYPYPGNEWLRENWDRISGGLFYSGVEGYAYAWLQTAIEAIKLAGSLDPEAINDAMLKLDFQSATGRVKFDPQKHSCKGTEVLGQIFKTPEGKWTVNIVWAPEDSGIPTKPPVIPKPW